MQKVNPFLQSALQEVPRLLGNIDRNPLSKTYGAADRAYWLYRTNTINSARYQEAIFTLALLYTRPFEGNVWHRHRELGEWIRAMARFTITLQQSDGSFDEWYPHEGSFVCTAFVTAALAESVRAVPELFSDIPIEAVLRKSATWLMAHNEKEVCNQLAGAITALELVAQITKEKAFAEAAQNKFEQLRMLQSTEGWWPEYGGPDIGYLTLTIEYLSRYWELTKDVRAREALDRAIVFVSYFLTPDGTAGGECFARNTEYVIPSGFARMASVNDDAHRVAAYCEQILNEGAGITPRVLDDRYTCYMLSNWLHAGLLYTPRTCAAPQPITMFFSHAGVFVEHNEKRMIVCNVKKGGSFRIYHDVRRVVDAGMAIRQGQKILSAQVLGSTGEYTGEKLIICGNFVHMKTRTMTPLVYVVLFVFQFTVGRIPMVQRFLKQTLRRVLIRMRGASRTVYMRTISLLPTSVVIEDEVAVTEGEVLIGERGVFALVPSTRYELVSQPHILTAKESRVEEKGTIRITRTFNT